MRLRQKRLPKASSLGNSVAGGNSAAGKASSPDHINVSSKKVFGGAGKNATRNACTMEKLVIHMYDKAWNAHTTEFDIVEEGNVPLLMSLPQMRNLGVQFRMSRALI